MKKQTDLFGDFPEEKVTMANRAYPPKEVIERIECNFETGTFTSKSYKITMYDLTDGYIRADFGGYQISAHRLVMLCAGIDIKEKEVHHKNHIRNDNRLTNLEAVSHKEHSAIHEKENREGRITSEIVSLLMECHALDVIAIMRWRFDPEGIEKVYAIEKSMLEAKMIEANCPKRNSYTLEGTMNVIDRI